MRVCKDACPAALAREMRECFFKTQHLFIRKREAEREREKERERDEGCLWWCVTLLSLSAVVYMCEGEGKGEAENRDSAAVPAPKRQALRRWGQRGYDVVFFHSTMTRVRRQYPVINVYQLHKWLWNHWVCKRVYDSPAVYVERGMDGWMDGWDRGRGRGGWVQGNLE